MKIQEVSADKQKQLLLEVENAFHADTSFSLVVAAEIECYLHLPQLSEEATLEELKQRLEWVLGVTKERGEGQYEVQLSPVNSCDLLAEQITHLREHLHHLAAKEGGTVSFAAKPFADQPGSGMHIHLHLTDKEKHNLFAEGSIDTNPWLRDALGGLCHYLKSSMVFFAPNEAAYARFTGGKEVPTTISWGGNNRTTALRIPDSVPFHRRIEHRVPSADASPYLILVAMLIAVGKGLINHMIPPPRIYGEAFLPQYGLERLPASLKEAEAAFNCSEMKELWLAYV